MDAGRPTARQWNRYGPGETWVAVQSWLGKPLVLEGDPETLARRYLTAYGPATARDFATWSGLPVPAARRGTSKPLTTPSDLIR